jgi:hypothetical protein
MNTRVILSLLTFSSLLYADEIDDLMGGFDDTLSETITIDESIVNIQKPELISVSGSLSHALSYNIAHSKPDNESTDFRGLSRARSKLELHFDSEINEHWKSKIELKAFFDALYFLRADNKYSTEMKETNQDEFESKEAYLLGSYDRFDIKIGRQTVVWGKSDTIRITDVINPLDNREPGMVDIEDLRLPVFMSKFDYYIDNWNLSTMLIHEYRIQKEAALGSDFLPTHIFPLPPEKSFPSEVYPTSELNKPQFALALNGRFSGWDLSFYHANVLDSRWQLDKTASNRDYSLMHMSGIAANIVTGSWLLKTEIAHLSNLRYSAISKTKVRLDTLLGIDYMGTTDTVLSLELANRHLYDYETSMQNAPNFVNEDEDQLAFRSNYSFDHNKGDINLLLSLFGAKSKNQGGFIRAWLNYEMADALTLTTGIIDYQGGEKPFFEAIKQNDRIFTEIMYKF